MAGLHVVHMVDHAFPHLSGYSVRTHELTRALSQQGLSNTVALSRHSFARSDPAYAEEGGFSRDGVIYTAPAPSRGFARSIVTGLEKSGIRGSTRIGRSLDMNAFGRNVERIAGNFQLVHAHSPPDVCQDAYTLARRFHVPLIYEVRGFWELTLAAQRGAGVDVHEASAGDAEAASRADAVITIGRAMADLLIDHGVPESSVTIVPNGVDVDRFRPRPPDESLAADLGLAGKKIVGAATNVRSLEGLDLVIESWPRVLKECPDAVFVLAGDGDDLPRLRDLARTVGCEESVVFLGRVDRDEVSRILGLFDVYVVPRRPDPVCNIVTPLKPLEAMAAGIPVVASDLPALRELITHDETGLLFTALDTGSLAQNLLALLQNAPMTREITERARRDCIDNRTWHSSAERCATLYSTLTGAQ